MVGPPGGINKQLDGLSLVGMGRGRGRGFVYREPRSAAELKLFHSFIYSVIFHYSSLYHLIQLHVHVYSNYKLLFVESFPSHIFVSHYCFDGARMLW